MKKHDAGYLVVGAIYFITGMILKEEVLWLISKFGEFLQGIGS